MYLLVHITCIWWLLVQDLNSYLYIAGGWMYLPVFLYIMGADKPDTWPVKHFEDFIDKL